ncbi:hypothetical protein NGM37_58165, partial [Streptomyces sp. TRM76130]|nr:hypothetical protein [Streptomyces sp. TRM76130]
MPSGVQVYVAFREGCAATARLYRHLSPRAFRPARETRREEKAGVGRMRLPVLTEEEMDQRQRQLAARIAGRRGAVRGPFRVWLHSPEMCERAESLGAFARFDCSLPKH